MRKPRRESPQNRWTRNTDKESYWKHQIDLWQRSGLSVRAFCKEHGIVEPSFYAWRRELIIRARESGEAIVENDLHGGTPNKVKDSRGRTIRVCFRQTDQPALEAVLGAREVPASPFVPLKVSGTEAAIADPAVVDTGIKLSTPSGFTIALSANSDLALLQQILSILEVK